MHLWIRTQIQSIARWNSEQSHDRGTGKLVRANLILMPLARNSDALAPPTRRRAEISGNFSMTLQIFYNASFFLTLLLKSNFENMRARNAVHHRVPHMSENVIMATLPLVLPSAIVLFLTVDDWGWYSRRLEIPLTLRHITIVSRAPLPIIYWNVISVDY